MAVTSRVFARSSSSVPICPGRRSSGGANSTGADASPSKSGTLWASPVGFPITWSTWPPRHRRSRPRPPDQIAEAADREREQPARGRAGRRRQAKARAGDQRSRSRGSGAGTAPFGRLTTTVIPWYGWRSRWAKRAPHRTARSAPRTRERRSLVARVARHLRDPRRRPHDGRRDVDRDVPLVADRVPVQLDMVPEPVQGGLDPVADRVRVPAGDRAVRVADPDRA